MNKHDILTEEEFHNYNIYDKIPIYLKHYCNNLNLKKKDINILDWGCGRGRAVLWLREMGYNAFGVDIDPEPIKKGICLIKKKGYNESILKLINLDEKTQFPDNFFHFSFSNQVFEHVKNLNSIALELFRITKKRGIGFHIFPAQKCFIEPHLKMPIIHWFPKKKIRKYLILANLKLGIEPRWKELEEYSNSDKLEKYFAYSINNTFYRKILYIRKVFQKNGFIVNFDTNNILKYENNKFYQLLKPFLNHILLNFYNVELLIKKV